MSELKVTAGAMLTCSCGMAPSTLAVLPREEVVEGWPVANIGDHLPMVNIPSFGMCRSLGNPDVASGTAAAQGVLTPMPCMPVIPANWTPGASTYMVGGLPMLTMSSMCLCVWGGVIQVASPGQVSSLAP